MSKEHILQVYQDTAGIEHAINHRKRSQKKVLKVLAYSDFFPLPPMKCISKTLENYSDPPFSATIIVILLCTLVKQENSRFFLSATQIDWQKRELVFFIAAQ